MYFLTNLFIISIFFLMIYFLNKKLLKYMDLKSNFECGFDMKQNVRMTFSLRFFSMTVVFLLFDLEFSIIFPMLIEQKTEKIWILMIILILMGGLMLEWNQGSLNWK